ncbi:hypothetical protein niasHT_010282 [Heterodera trifolii]|uniref:Uncharacterized protein n=1 Tax=Heterodera trifolii TaxID=157864 RepID=A0ABD2M5C4_9BILA
MAQASDDDMHGYSFVVPLTGSQRKRTLLSSQKAGKRKKERAKRRKADLDRKYEQSLKDASTYGPKATKAPKQTEGEGKQWEGHNVGRMAKLGGLNPLHCPLKP